MYWYHNLIQNNSMKKIKHTPEQIITKLRTVEMLVAQGSSVAQAVKQIGVTEQTYYGATNMVV